MRPLRKLLEGAAVLALMGVVGAAMSPLTVRYVQDNRLQRAQGDLQKLATAYRRYHSDTGGWPCNWNRHWSGQTELADQRCFHARPRGQEAWNGPYLSRGADVGSERRLAGGEKGWLDPWGRPYVALYLPRSDRYPNAAGGFVGLLSRGPDGRQHTALGHALQGHRRGDDILQIVTRQID